MKKCVIACVVVLTVTVLSGCTGSIHSGTVTGKIVEAEQPYTHLVTMAGETPVFEMRTDDEDYCFTLAEDDETGYVCVSEEVFNSVNVNEYYSEGSY